MAGETCLRAFEAVNARRKAAGRDGARGREGCAVIVFAKAPEPGVVKTRLVPLLGADGAAALHARLVERALVTAHAAAIGAVELACAPDADHPFFRYCGERYGAALARQSGGDLGARMHEACGRALARAASVIVIGADCPALTPAHLREARRALAEDREAVLAPAEDGGYVLIGLTRCDERIFDGIAWGGNRVMADTRNRLAALAWNWLELDTLWDVDRPEDYERLIDSGLLDTGSGEDAQPSQNPFEPQINTDETKGQISHGITRKTRTERKT